MRKLWNHYERIPEYEPDPLMPEIDPAPRMPEIGEPVKDPYKIAGKLHNAWKQFKSWIFVAEQEEDYEDDEYDEEERREQALHRAAQARPAYEDEYDQQRRKRDVEQALTQWKNAKTFFENVTDPTLVDYAVYEMEAARKRYIYLLQTVRQKEEPNNGVQEEM